MEELSGTVTLEREIMDDARRKAARMLSSADAEATRILAEAQRRLEDDCASMDAAGAAASERYRQEVLARLPLDTLRLRTTRADELLRASLTSWLDALPEERVEGFVTRRVDAACRFFEGESVIIEYKGVSEATAARIAGHFAGAASVALQANMALPARGIVATGSRVTGSSGIGPSGIGPSVAASSATPSRVAEPHARGARTRLEATLELARDIILREKRGELAEALVPGMMRDD